MLSVQPTCNSVLHHQEKTRHIGRIQSCLPSRSAGALVCKIVDLSVWRQIHFPTKIHLKLLQTPAETHKNIQLNIVEPHACRFCTNKTTNREALCSVNGFATLKSYFHWN